MDLLKGIALVWLQYCEFLGALAEYKRMSDRKLSDLGLTRADIPRLAYAEAEGRAAALIPSRPARAPTLAPAEA